MHITVWLPLFRLRIWPCAAFRFLPTLLFFARIPWAAILIWWFNTRSIGVTPSCYLSLISSIALVLIYHYKNNLKIHVWVAFVSYMFVCLGLWTDYVRGTSNLGVISFQGWTKQILPEVLNATERQRILTLVLYNIISSTTWRHTGRATSQRQLFSVKMRLNYFGIITKLWSVVMTSVPKGNVTCKVQVCGCGI